MKILDTPLQPLFGRTPRELILISGGLGICVMEFMRPELNPWHLGVFVTGTALFAVRFFAARPTSILWIAAPASALPAALASSAVALIAMPYAAAHIWRSLFAR